MAFLDFTGTILWNDLVIFYITDNTSTVVLFPCYCEVFSTVTDKIYITIVDDGDWKKIYRV